MAWRFTDYSRAVFVIDGMITFLLAAGVRFASSLAGEALAKVAGRGLRIAVVGCEPSLELLRSDLESLAGGKGRIVGVIGLPGDDANLDSPPGLGSIDNLRTIAEDHGVRMVWLIPHGMKDEEITRVRDACQNEGLILREVALSIERSRQRG